MEKDGRIRLGLLQCVPAYLKLEDNMRAFERWAENAHKLGVDLFITCEGQLDGICAGPKDIDTRLLLDHAQDVSESDYLQRARKTARRLQMHIVFGFTRHRESGAANAALFVDAGGNDIGVYHKTHLRLDDTRFIAGADLPVFESRLGTVGLLLCKDRNYPESSRTLKLKGAELIVIPSYGSWDEKNEWQMRARARENEVHIAFAHPRTSFVCNPMGDLIAKLTTNVPDILVCDVVLADSPCVKIPRRRPDLYGVIAEPKGPNPKITDLRVKKQNRTGTS